MFEKKVEEEKEKKTRTKYGTYVVAVVKDANGNLVENASVEFIATGTKQQFMEIWQAQKNNPGSSILNVDLSSNRIK